MGKNDPLSIANSLVMYEAYSHRGHFQTKQLSTAYSGMTNEKYAWGNLPPSRKIAITQISIQITKFWLWKFAK